MLSINVNWKYYIAILFKVFHSILTSKFSYWLQVRPNTHHDNRISKCKNEHRCMHNIERNNTLTFFFCSLHFICLQFPIHLHDNQSILEILRSHKNIFFGIWLNLIHDHTIISYAHGQNVCIYYLTCKASNLRKIGLKLVTMAII